MHPGASATNLFARQLEQAGRGVLAGVSKVATAVVLQSAAAGALSTLRALDHSTPSGAVVGPARFAQHRGRPELLDVYASARDPATAVRVWELTEQALGMAAASLSVARPRSPDQPAQGLSWNGG